MIKAKNRNYYLDEKLITKVWKENDKFYASDKCMQRYEIEEKDFVRLGGKV